MSLTDSKHQKPFLYNKILFLLRASNAYLPGYLYAILISALLACDVLCGLRELVHRLGGCICSHLSMYISMSLHHLPSPLHNDYLVLCNCLVKRSTMIQMFSVINLLNCLPPILHPFSIKYHEPLDGSRTDVMA